MPRWTVLDARLPLALCLGLALSGRGGSDALSSASESSAAPAAGDSTRGPPLEACVRAVGAPADPNFASAEVGRFWSRPACDCPTRSHHRTTITGWRSTFQTNAVPPARRSALCARGSQLPIRSGAQAPRSRSSRRRAVHWRTSTATSQTSGGSENARAPSPRLGTTGLDARRLPGDRGAGPGDRTGHEF